MFKKVSGTLPLMVWKNVPHPIIFWRGEGVRLVRIVGTVMVESYMDIADWQIMGIQYVEHTCTVPVVFSLGIAFCLRHFRIIYIPD
jgi:hypothetical protein